MKDLVSGFTATNTTVGSEVNSLGATVFPSANDAATSFLGFPALIPGEVLANETIAVIFQPRTFGVGQGFIGENTVTPGFKIQTSNTAFINLTDGGSNLWSVPAVAGNNYFVASCFIKGGSPQTRSVVANLTTGQIWLMSNAAGGAGATAGADYTALTFNTTTGVNNGRLAAAMISASSLSLAQLLDWANDPWSLWYDTAPKAVLFSSLRNTSAVVGDTTLHLAATEARDVAHFTVTSKTQVHLAATEARDTAHFAVNNLPVGDTTVALATTEAMDIASFAILNPQPPPPPPTIPQGPGSGSIFAGRNPNTVITQNTTVSAPGTYGVTVPGVTVTLANWTFWTRLGSIKVKDMTGSSVPNITVQAFPAGGGLIDGSPSVVMSTPKQSLTFEPFLNGTDWSIV